MRCFLAFKDAVEKGNDSLVAWLLRENEIICALMDTEWENGDYCLHLAVRNKHYNLVRYLLNKGKL